MTRRPHHPLPRLYRWRTNIFQRPALLPWSPASADPSRCLSRSLTERAASSTASPSIWARGCVSISGARLTVRGAENLRKHPVAVYASNHTSYMDTPVIFAALALPVPHPRQKRALDHALHRLVSQPLRPDSDRHRQIPRHALQPRRRRRSPARRHAAFRLPRRRPHARRRAAALPLRRSLPRHPRPGPARSHRASAASTTCCPSTPATSIPASSPSPSANPSPPAGLTIRQTDELTARLRAAIADLQSPDVSLNRRIRADALRRTIEVIDLPGDVPS